MEYINLIIIILIALFSKGCNNNDKKYKIRMEIYYNVFDSALDGNLKLCRAMIRIPIEELPKSKTIKDSILIKFIKKDDSFIYNKIINKRLIPKEIEFSLLGKIIGFSSATNEAYIGFNIFPLKVTDEQHKIIKYEKDYTKFISVYLILKSNSKLQFHHFDNIKKIRRKPVRFK